MWGVVACDHWDFAHSFKLEDDNRKLIFHDEVIVQVFKMVECWPLFSRWLLSSLAFQEGTHSTFIKLHPKCTGCTSRMPLFVDLCLFGQWILMDNYRIKSSSGITALFANVRRYIFSLRSFGIVCDFYWVLRNQIPF